MIARVWKGSTPASKAEGYSHYLSLTGIKEYLATEGNRGVLVLRREATENSTEFVLVSFWDSMEAIQRFSGPETDRAVYYPEDKEFLLTMEPNVTHYEVAHNSLTENSPQPGNAD